MTRKSSSDSKLDFRKSGFLIKEKDIPNQNDQKSNLPPESPLMIAKNEISLTHIEPKSESINPAKNSLK